jgi:Trk K+ transport system NAD-binding subunit
MTVVTVTMAFTPLMANLGRNIKRRLYLTQTLRDNKIIRELGDIENHIVIIGFSKIGRIVADEMRKRHIPHLILSTNHNMVRIEKGNGYHAYYGDPLNLDILNRIRIKNSEMAVVCEEDEILSFKIINMISENFPRINIVTKTENSNNIERLKKAGAHEVISKNFETGTKISNRIIEITKGL